jgi:hypothetical protein
MRKLSTNYYFMRWKNMGILNGSNDEHVLSMDKYDLYGASSPNGLNSV